MLDVSSLALHMPASLTDTFRILDLCGVLLNGILGGLIARRKNFDLVGFVVLAMLTATAGGILRDVMIQAGPPFALTDPYYLYTACLGATVAWFVPLTSRPTRRLLVVADAVILGCWAATGASKALTHGLGVMPALLLGCLTAIGGSMIRDVAVGETPAVFGGNKLYAIPALIAAGTQVLAVRMGAADAHAMLVSTAVGAGLCVLAYWRSWQLPVISDRERRRAGRRTGPGGAGRLAPGAHDGAAQGPRLARSRGTGDRQQYAVGTVRTVRAGVGGHQRPWLASLTGRRLASPASTGWDWPALLADGVPKSRSLTASATFSVTASPWLRTACLTWLEAASTRVRTKGCSATLEAADLMRSYWARPARVPSTYPAPSPRMKGILPAMSVS